MSSASADPPVRRRMDPERRQEQLLEIARRQIAAHGVDFTLDELARAAGISPPLMRHYFKNRDGLLTALAEQMLAELVAIFAGPGGDFPARLGAYLDYVAANAWAHRLWLAGSVTELPNSEPIRTARRRLVQLAGGDQPGADAGQRIRAEGFIALIESAATRWLETGEPDRDELLEILLDAGDRLGITTRG